MADHGADIDRRAARGDRVEVLREGLEAPFFAHACLQRGDAHALDLLERADDEVAMRPPRRRDAEAAIAHHHRGDAVPGRDAEHAVPQDLRVVMRVDVDEARRDDAALGVDRLACLVRRVAQRHHLAAGDADIALEARLPGAVDDAAAGDLQVVWHGGSVPNPRRLSRAVRGQAWRLHEHRASFGRLRMRRFLCGPLRTCCVGG